MSEAMTGQGMVARMGGTSGSTLIEELNDLDNDICSLDDAINVLSERVKPLSRQPMDKIHAAPSDPIPMTGVEIIVRMQRAREEVRRMRDKVLYVRDQLAL